MGGSGEDDVEGGGGDGEEGVEDGVFGELRDALACDACPTAGVIRPAHDGGEEDGDAEENEADAKASSNYDISAILTGQT